MSVDYSHLEFSRPAKHVKTINVEPVPQCIFDGMAKYENAARGYNPINFERSVKDKAGELIPTQLLVTHRPQDAQVLQIYRLSTNPSATDIQRITYFDIGAGRTIPVFLPIIGEDWRGIWRGGGAVMAMDADGNEMFQLWRYWEDALCDQIIPKIDGELDNFPGTGRFERITDDGFKYTNLVVSESNKLLAFASNKDNKTDTLIYITRLVGSNTGAMRHLTMSASYRSLYIVDISDDELTEPELIILPNSTEKEEGTFSVNATFSRDPSRSHLVYLITNAYGDFKSVVTYDIQTHVVSHITTPVPNLHAIRPMLWETENLQVTRENIFFRANVEGWSSLFVMPLSGPHKDTVMEVKLNWEGGSISFISLHIKRTQWQTKRTDIIAALHKVDHDEKGNLVIAPTLEKYCQASSEIPPFRTLPPKLIRYNSFDGLPIPVMYYHPNIRQSAVPLVINIHGGPESQATAQSRIPIHGYLLNEMGCAVMYPNVRGSSGYGKAFLAADDVEKREDSVKDIGALLDHIDQNMKNELDSTHIAVMGGSYGGYMVYASLTHFSSKLACGVANFGIAHWPSFLRNTAAHRRAARRLEYGDETDPKIREFLEKISPLNNAFKISAPLSIAHGETDSRVTVEEAIRMQDIVSKGGVYTELMICEKEGHGFKQKSVIEFTNAAKIHFLERFLLSNVKSGL